MSGSHRGTPPLPKQSHSADGRPVSTSKQAERVLVSESSLGFRVSALESCSEDSILSLMARDSTTRSFMVERLGELLQGALVAELTSLSNQLKLTEVSRQETAHKQDQEIRETHLKCEALERQNSMLLAAEKEKDVFASKLRAELERLDAELSKCKALLEKTEHEMKSARHDADQLATWKKDAEFKLTQSLELQARADSQIQTFEEQLAQSKRELESKARTYTDDVAQLMSAHEAEQSSQQHARELEHFRKELSRAQDEITRANQAVSQSVQESSKQKQNQLAELELEWQTKFQASAQETKDQLSKQLQTLIEDHKKEKAELQDKIKYLRESSVRKDVYEAVLKEKEALAKQILDGLVAQERQIEQEGFLHIVRSANGHVKATSPELNPNAHLSSRLAASEATNLQLGLRIKGLEEDRKDQAKKLKLYEEEIHRQARMVKELRSCQAEKGAEDNEQRLAIEELLSERGHLEARITELLAFCEAQQETNLKSEGLKNALQRQLGQQQEALKAKDQSLQELKSEFEVAKDKLHELQEKAAAKGAERSRVLEDSAKCSCEYTRPSSQLKLLADGRVFELEERLRFQEHQTLAARSEVAALHELVDAGKHKLESEQSRTDSERLRLQALVDDYRDRAAALRRKLSGRVC